jgi:hypothetical protein
VRNLEVDRDKRVEDLLELVQLTGLGGRFPRQVRGGGGRRGWGGPGRGAEDLLELVQLTGLGGGALPAPGEAGGARAVGRTGWRSRRG